MAKNSKPAPKGKPAPVQKIAPKKITSTPVRNSAIPKPAKTIASVTPKAITHDAIAKRAYEIHQSGRGGSETDNWHRAERELRGI